jgi:hypothetical protein
MSADPSRKPEPVATIYRVQHKGLCEDCGKADVMVVEADIGHSSWTLVCLDCLGQRLGEMRERRGEDGTYGRQGDHPSGD